MIVRKKFLVCLASCALVAGALMAAGAKAQAQQPSQQGWGAASAGQNSGAQASGTNSAQSSTAPKSSGSTATRPHSTAPAAMTNRDVIQLTKAKLSDDVIIAKIKKSKTHFNLSTDGLVALKNAGVSDPVISAMMDAGTAASSAGASSGGGAAAGSATRSGAPAASMATPSGPASNTTKEVAAKETGVAKNSAPPAPPRVTAAPANYGVYIYYSGGLKQLGAIQTKVQTSKFRSMLKVVPFVRQKIDINIPGAHSTSRYEALRPTFFAYFPPSRDVSKFKLLQCKITGQKFDQRTVANASILYSTEQNQDEVPLDIGPTDVRDLYRLTPREDLTSGEFAFVEGNTGSNSASNIQILDVYDFGIDRKEEKVGLKDYLDTLPAANVGDAAFLSWERPFAQNIVDSKEAKTGITGSMEGWFKRQYSSLDVYWDDPQFARAFARLEMLDKGLTNDEAMKLAALLLNQQQGNQYYVIVSIGGKVGSGHLIGADEGERLMRPFDASLSNDKGKDIVPAKHLQFIGGYAGVWRVDFDQNSIRGPLMSGANGASELVFEARLNQNLDFKATFPMDKVKGTAVPAAAPAQK